MKAVGASLHQKQTSDRRMRIELANGVQSNTRFKTTAGLQL
jgi:hypothetical protein